RHQHDGPLTQRVVRRSTFPAKPPQRSDQMSRTSRRNFLKTSAVIGAGYWALGGVAPRESRSANETINFASIGVGGKGDSDSADAGRAGNMVAICDIDDNQLNRAGTKWPEAKKYHDFRKMLDEMGKSID